MKKKNVLYPLQKLGFWCLTILMTSTTFAFEFELNPKGLTPAEYDSTLKVIHIATELLPPLFKSHLDKKIVFEYTSISHLGESSGNKIQLSHAIKQMLLQDPEKASGLPLNISSKHKNTYQLALGTILHELAHQYDFHKTLQLNPKRQDCTQFNEGNPLPPHCAWTNYNYNVSDDPKFLYSIPWNSKNFKGQQLFEEDDSTALSPNAYEFKSPQEAFAVNFEFFILDPEFKCRRPSVYNYLSKHFAYQPHLGIPCQNNFYSTTISNSVFNGTVFEKIDPRRVAAVHYLLAGDGDSLMSSWGHSMIRLVICAPERVVVNEKECINDIAYHRVISYRAAVADLSIDHMKGLFGKYASKVYIFPLLNVINEYTKLELRDLTSYPLKLSQSQIDDLVQRVQQQNWSYLGKYYFSNNNCSTETYNLIKHVVPEFSVFASLQINTPKSLRSALFQNQLALDPMTNPTDLKSYFWPSKASQYQKIIDKISIASGFQIENLKKFYNLTLSEKQSLFKAILNEKKELASMYILLDTYHEKLINKKNSVALRIEQNKKSSAVLNQLKQTLDQQNKIGLNYFNQSYGIPTDEEIEKAVLTFQNSKSNQQEPHTSISTAEQEVLQILGPEFKNQLEFVLNSKKSIKAILTKTKGDQS